jgi:antitoxin ParD1/3/4
MAAMLREAVAGGDYASSSEVVREALRLWKLRRDSQAEAVEELRRAWRDGVASGPGTLGDIEDIGSEARRRLKASAAA